ncbi:MAG TPA: hypothetical protein VGX95_12915 [Xanthobacteraceae bacterium]|jgi:hypothetical protein|nr:hypothetical protein [Xanthobacteraceae bacterium]
MSDTSSDLPRADRRKFLKGAALLSDQEAADMWAWLHALPGRKSAKDFPLLNQ